MSHNIRTGAWRKAKITPKSHFNFLMNSTNAQRSFIHELCAQQLGRSPSNLWGVPVPKELVPHTDRHTLKHVMHAAKHAPHEFGRLISEHKKASGFISALGELVARSKNSRPIRQKCRTIYREKWCCYPTRRHNHKGSRNNWHNCRPTRRHTESRKEIENRSDCRRAV